MVDLTRNKLITRNGRKRATIISTLFGTYLSAEGIALRDPMLYYFSTFAPNRHEEGPVRTGDKYERADKSLDSGDYKNLRCDRCGTPTNLGEFESLFLPNICKTLCKRCVAKLELSCGAANTYTALHKKIEHKTDDRVWEMLCRT